MDCPNWLALDCAIDLSDEAPGPSRPATPPGSAAKVAAPWKPAELPAAATELYLSAKRKAAAAPAELDLASPASSGSPYCSWDSGASSAGGAAAAVCGGLLSLDDDEACSRPHGVAAAAPSPPKRVRLGAGDDAARLAAASLMADLQQRGSAYRYCTQRG